MTESGGAHSRRNGWLKLRGRTRPRDLTSELPRHDGAGRSWCRRCGLAVRLRRRFLGRSRRWHWWRNGRRGQWPRRCRHLGLVGQPGRGRAVQAGVEGLRGEDGTKITYQIVSGDYHPKLLTQLAGGSAPDAFYVGDRRHGQADRVQERHRPDRVHQPSPTRRSRSRTSTRVCSTGASRPGARGLRPAGGLQPAGLLVQQGHGRRGRHHPEPGRSSSRPAPGTGTPSTTS